MASGVKVSDTVLTKFNEMKMNKVHRYMVMNIDLDQGQIVVTKTVDKSPDQKQDYCEMLEMLTKDKCCFILLDMNVKNKRNDQEKETLYIITWCPDNGGIKEKMMYASTKQALHDKLREGVVRLQANDLSDLEYTAVFEA